MFSRIIQFVLQTNIIMAVNALVMNFITIFFLFFAIALSQESIYVYNQAKEQALKELNLKEVFKKLIFNKKN